MRKRLLSLVLAMGVLTALPQQARAVSDYGLALVGTTPISDEGLVIPDNATNRFIVLETNPSRFSIFDPAKQKMVFTAELPYALKAGNKLGYAWDADRRGLFLVGYPDLAAAAATIDPLLVHITTAGKVLSAVPLKAFQNGIAVVGITYYAPSNRVYALGQVADPTTLAGTYIVQVNEIDPATGLSSWPTGAQVVPSCQKLVTLNRPAAITRNRHTGRLYFGCGTGNFALLPQPGVPAVADIDISDPASLKVAYHPIAGGYNQGETVADEEGGKYIMVAQGSGSPVQAAWIFDEVHGTVTGVVSAGHLNVHYAAVDQVTGRLFLGIDKALLVGSTRLLKTPQAIKLPIPIVEQGASGTASLPGPGYLLVTEKLSRGDLKPVVRLYKAKLPTFPPPAPENRDASTIDAPETPNVVAANFNGSGQAYGVRGFVVGGVNGAAQNIVQSPDDWWGKLQGLVQVPSLSDPSGTAQTPPVSQNVNDGDRQVYFARVNRAFVSEGEASATAIKADRDTTTDADYGTVTSPDQRVDPDQPSQTRQAWPYSAAACADHGDGVPDQSADGASAKCDQSKGQVTTTAIFDQANGVPGVIQTGGSDSSSTLTRAVGQGVSVETTAEARDVQIGVVHIGKIISLAKAKAAGRPGTSDAHYTRTFENVSMPNFSCTTNCDPQQVVDHMNAVLGSKIIAELPRYTAQKTPKGAAASAEREAWEHQQDVVVNDQAETERQVAALRVTFLNDNSARSRVVFEFAGAEADAEYDLYRLDRGGFGPSETSVLDVPGLPSITPGGLVVPPFSPTPNVAGGTGHGGSGPGSLLHQLGHGLRVLLMGRHSTLLSVCLWALLLTPIFFAARRRYLLRLMGEV
jgi:hypothetical protein